MLNMFKNIIKISVNMFNSDIFIDQYSNYVIKYKKVFFSSNELVGVAILWYILEKNMGKLLIRGVNWIGDAVMTLPALRCIRTSFKEDEIHLMVKKHIIEIFLNDPNIDNLIEYKDDYKGIKGKIIASRRLKHYSFSKAILFQNAFDAAALVYLSGIKERIGYNRDGRGFLLTKPVQINKKIKRLHHILYYLNLLKETGVDVNYRHPWIYLSIEERIKAQNILNSVNRPIILINPGAAYGSAKRWPTKYFAILIEMIIKDLNGSIIITGSTDEQKIVTEIISKVNLEKISYRQILNLTGKISLREFISILSQVDIVVTNDSGPMHLAYAVGTPVVAIFGSTDPNLTGPPSYINLKGKDFPIIYEFNTEAKILWKKVSCSPCFERECPKGEAICLKKISAKEVFEEIKQLLPKKKAIFFDRDGTLCKDVHYLNKMEKLKIYPEVERLKKLKEKGYLLIGVTNQSGIARGIVDKEFTENINRIFKEKYGFDEFYYCPHHPKEYCACRKPSPGMLFRARAEYGINLRNSFVVGDKETDIQLANSIGAKGILVRSRHTQEKSITSKFVIDTLMELDKLIK